MSEPSVAEPDARRPRADALRNRDALLAAGEALFAEHGATMPFDEVARVAGVGKGTLYRHFPTRDHLLVGLLQERFDRLTREAERLFDDEHPLDGVVSWLREFDRYPLRSRRLGTRVGEALTDQTSAVSTACQPMKASFRRLLARAQASGEVRAEIDESELLTVIASLPEQFRNDDGSSPFLDVILRGVLTERASLA
jgi:AcrR family transcriptional regulator